MAEKGGSHKYYSRGIQNSVVMVSDLQKNDKNPIIETPRYQGLRIYYGADNRSPERDMNGNPIIRKDITKEWYVTYEFFDVECNDWVPVFVRKGINRIKELEKRDKFIQVLLQATKEDLEAGWNPVKERFETVGEMANEWAALPLDTAFKKALEGKAPDLNKETTMHAYTSNLNLLLKAFKELKYDFPIGALRRVHVIEAIDKIREMRERVTGKRFGNKRYNELLGSVQSLLTYMTDKKEVFQISPGAKIEYLKTPKKGKRFLPLTDEELERISSHLRVTDFNFYVYTKIIFRTSVRPIEITRLKVKDFDTETGFIKIEDHNSKDGETDFVPLDDDLIADLRQFGIEAARPDQYLFSDRYTLEPGWEKLNRNRVSERWRVKVKSPETGLGIDKNMYALKATGGDARLKIRPAELPENITVEEMFRMLLKHVQESTMMGKVKQLQVLMRHKTESMTEIYLSKQKEFAKEKIKQEIPKY